MAKTLTLNITPILKKESRKRKKNKKKMPFPAFFAKKYEKTRETALFDEQTVSEDPPREPRNYPAEHRRPKDDRIKAGRAASAPLHEDGPFDRLPRKLRVGDGAKNASPKNASRAHALVSVKTNSF